MENISGNYYVPNIGIKGHQPIETKKNKPEIQKQPEPTAKASAQNVAAYYQNIKVPSVEEVIDVKMKDAATLPNGGFVFRNEIDGGKAVVKNSDKEGFYDVALIRDSASEPEEVITLSEEEFFMNPDLCSGFVIPKDDGTYDVTLLNPTSQEEIKLFGTNNMKKSELVKIMQGRYFN